jgi:hypothetical protein
MPYLLYDCDEYTDVLEPGKINSPGEGCYAGSYLKDMRYFPEYIPGMDVQEYNSPNG